MTYLRKLLSRDLFHAFELALFGSGLAVWLFDFASVIAGSPHRRPRRLNDKHEPGLPPTRPRRHRPSHVPFPGTTNTTRRLRLAPTRQERLPRTPARLRYRPDTQKGRGDAEYRKTRRSAHPTRKGACRNGALSSCYLYLLYITLAPFRRY